METLKNPLPNVPWLEILIFALSIAIVFIVFDHTVLNDSTEQPVALNVPVPEQCRANWKGKILQEPKLRVLFQIMDSLDHETHLMLRLLARVRYNATARPMDNCSASSIQPRLMGSIER